jgi:mono/diheme cytochrome c family protein
MMLRILTIGLAVALVVLIGLNIAVRRGSVTTPPLEYFPDMVRTARYNAFEANPNFPDGMTLRVPPAGTIPRGMLPLSSAPTTPADGDPVNPFTASDTGALQRGAVVFNAFCVPCHGATGLGDGIVVQHGFPAPPSLLDDGPRETADAQIFSVISDGFGNMPPYAAQIAREDRWKSILHLRKLQNERQPAADGK